MTTYDWAKYGGEKSEAEIVRLLGLIRQKDWNEYQRIKLVCYLAALSECERLRIPIDGKRDPDKKIIAFPGI